MSNLELIGKKLGMTREFYTSGQSVPVTVLKMEKARVINLIEKEKRGYTAIQIGCGTIKSSKLSKQMKGFFVKKTCRMLVFGCFWENILSTKKYFEFSLGYKVNIL